ncbi:MAG: ABC transporter ATP-binding protein/permease [Ruminococcaceae bacterium]|nr:ABC transporter ATP-binding protein/permease [Oscillospiraceae bacterium]
MIKIQSLNKFFNKGRQNEIHVINNVDLQLPEKGMVAIFGKSGCGKTTLLNVIGGLDKFHSGTLSVKGENIRDKTDVVRNKYMGYIFQNYNLNKEETCFENVADALYLCGITDKKIIEERVNAALSNVDMDKYSKRTPDTLSGGQQQRIAIARAIVKNPPIILADEPTGNLDEANTIMIMDLLKEISKEHLVLLVTHEANLVDYYCDTVIELSDGKVISIKNNSNADGYSAKDKNAIYLGELENSCLNDEKAEVEYYGEALSEPIKLKIINNGGKLYIKVETEGVSILDETSEIKLKEGVYEKKADDSAEHKHLQMSSLPPITGDKFGTLFSLKSSLKSGYAVASKKQKKGKKLLRKCMGLFAALLVFSSAAFGNIIDVFSDTKNLYNHNMFFVYTKDGEISAKINEAVGSKDLGIDYVSLRYGSVQQSANLMFQMGNFETFDSEYYSNTFMVNAAFLDVSLAKDLPLVAGKKENLENVEMVLTTKVADILLEKSSLGYIKEYKDLLGIISRRLSIDGKNIQIAGIVESNESAVYLTSVAVAKVGNIESFLNVRLDSDKGYQVGEGECILIAKTSENLPELNSTVKINGIELKVKEKYTDCSYEEWLLQKGIKKQSESEFFTDLLKAENPSVEETSENFNEEFEKIYNEKYALYLEYFYAESDEFLKYQYAFNKNDFTLWLYVEKNVDIATPLKINDRYYAALEYKKIHGEYPDLNTLKNYSLKVDMEQYDYLYREEFEGSQKGEYLGAVTYIVDEKDYVAFSKQTGETHKSAMAGFGYSSGFEKVEKYAEIAVSDVVVDMDYSTNIIYTAIHSNNPKATKAWIENEFSNIETVGSYKPYITPDFLFNEIIRGHKETIIGNIISMGVILLLCSLCMYFIMRSSLMSRVKEVGIYRAIGVSKKNLVYKFMVEAVVLFALTVFVGYILSSGFIWACLSISKMLESVFFYPAWYALCVLLVLLALCVFCGVIPIMLLLKKTPSQILAKYDV